MSDLISRADAIEAVHKYFVEAFNNEPHEIDEDGDDVFTDMKSVNALLHHNKMVSKALKALPSADAVPKWNCTADFVAEQLDRLRNMTDEEKWEFFRRFFGMGDAVQGEWIRKEKEYNDCDGHRAYYWHECSVCGARPPKDQWKNEWHSNFCPSCGARMENTK